MRILLYLLIGIATSPPTGLSAQTAAFDVASIKPSDPTHGHVGVLTYPGGRVNFGHQTLESLIADAFDLQAFQISGGPGWVRGDQYDIDAKPPANSESAKANPSSIKLPMNSEQHQMLQSLLADRFQLKFHREIKDGPVYLLEKGSKRLALENAKDKDAFPWVGSATQGGMMTGTGMAGINAPMNLLAERLMPYLGRPVIDKTGIQGAFDFRYLYVSDDPHPDVISTILISVEAIGLKLQASRDPVETIVIDHAEKPSPN